MVSAFKEALKSGKFVVTSEVAPPKGTNLEKTGHHIELLKDKVDDMNITDETFVVFTSDNGPFCGDNNEMTSRGINNVLCLTGDSVILGDHKEAKGVFDLDSSQLLAGIRTMEKGKDLGGNDLDGSVSFCAGAIVTPEADPIEPQLIKFEKKIEAGAEFIQTQAVYDLDNFQKFMDYARQFPAKVLAGIILLTSAPMARFMNKNVAGVMVPQELIDEMDGAPKGRKLDKGVEIAGRMIKRIADERMCDGVHIMAIGKEELVPDIMSAAGLI